MTEATTKGYVGAQRGVGSKVAIADLKKVAERLLACEIVEGTLYIAGPSSSGIHRARGASMSAQVARIFIVYFQMSTH